MTVLLCGTFIVSPLTVPRAQAMPVEILANAPDQLTKILDGIFTQLVRAGTVALFNAAQTFLGQVAFDAANYVASGGKGQNPLTQAKSPGDYFSQVGEDALGSAIGSLSDNFFEGNLGFDLCKPSAGKLLNLQLSLGNFVPSVNSAFTRPKPVCSFTEIVNNYNEFYTTLSSRELLGNIGASFNSNASDVGVALQVLGKTAVEVSTGIGKSEADRAENGAFKGITDVVGGNVKTPASLIQAQTSESLISGPKISEDTKRNAILSTAADQGFAQLAMYTASMFVNTLGSKLMARIMEKGLINAFDFSDLDSPKSASGVASVSGPGANPDAIPSRGRADARQANLELRDVSLIRQSNIEITAELIACPDVRGTWNCVMDQQLAQAVRGNACDNGSCTIVKALDRGLLKGDWNLYPDSMVRQNQDKNCYNQAYCAGNLRKLRLMRIVPVGLEFAANSDANIERCASAAGCVSLKEVVDNFTNCSTSGERDATHPWCKLVDPSWVLASFEQQCRLTGYGDQLLSGRLAQRKEECSDIQTCLKRNDKGECIGGFGYCVAEKTVYRFKGDECSAQAASCRNFATRSGAAVSYLRSTLDYGVCSADNVGCLGYATLRRPDGSWISAATSTTYFDQTLKPCGANDDGCTRLLAAEVGGSSLNLLTNASFERTSGAPLQLVGWYDTATFTSTPLPDGGTAMNGSQALSLTGGSQYTQRVAAAPGRLMTISIFARAAVAGHAPSFKAGIMQFTDDTFTSPIIGAYGGAGALFKSATCMPGGSEPLIKGGDGATNYGTDWRRFDCSFLTTSRTHEIELIVNGSNTFVDAVQLEEGQFATNYIDGANNALPVVYMKTAPDDFQCTGAASDPASCQNFARVCRQVDAGCQGYTDGSASPEVPAILSSNDLCPAECVGYSEYRKQSAAFDLVVDADSRFSDPRDASSSYFIASTATQCSQQDVGCEVFTNLEAASAGGEQTSAYSYLRLCEKPSAGSQTYFTWEGSETTGYQLRTWALIGALDAFGVAPKIITRRGPDGTYKNPASCNEGSWRTGLDADCRQFYDRAGLVYYAYFSQTVLSSTECKPLRLSGRVSTDDCTKTGGNFNGSTGECSYNAMPTESRSCNVQLAGCRAYAGANAGGGYLSVNENFRSGVGNFTSGPTGPGVPTLSPESLLVGDQSLRLQSTDISSRSTNVAFASAPGDLFRVSFWAKGASMSSTLTLKTNNTATVGLVNLSGDWQRYSVGLFNGDTATTTLSWTLSGSSAFLDEVRVERVRDTAYVVKDSWNTPASCDQTFSGIPEPQAMLGCRQYTDSFQNKINASRFTRLCRQDAIGCRAFVDTRNSDSSEAQSFPSSDVTPVATSTFRVGYVPTAADFFPSTTTTRPADRMRYLVYETSKLCQSENMSCRAFGKPVYSTDRSTIDSFDTIYIKDDITAYGQAMCRPSEEFCEEFSYQSAKDYFKDPGDKSCEYKEGVRMTGTEVAGLAPGTYSGWYRKGGNTPCYPGNLQGGNFFGLPKRGDTPYTGWVGLCKPADGECTEFRDPNDTSDPQYRTGRPYYFVDNSKLDKTTCSGNADQGSGCILLRNQSIPTLNYSSQATDLAYRGNNFRAVQPIDCAANPDSEFCTHRCRGTKITRVSAGAEDIITPYLGGICTSDPECATLAPPEGCTVICYDTRDPAGVLGTVCTSTDCSVTYNVSCVPPENDANVLVKVSTDRDCSQWLGCQSAETVFDPVTSQYKDVCTNLALCNKTTDTPGDIFCANYVDRANATTEPIMTQGKYFDIANYSSRQTGLGTNDYSGYALPDSFQVPDTAVTRVGVDGALTVTENENRFANDYRLAAVAHIPVNVGGLVDMTTPLPLVPATAIAANEASVLEGSGIGAANPVLRLCQHKGSGIIGYYREEDRKAATSPTSPKSYFNCYLPLRRESDSYNFQNLVGTFGLDDPRVDPVLAKAFPAPECRANPEADSPFALKYVTTWDLTVNPPKPILKINGYTNANVCVYGEDCSCSYKRAEYEVPTLTQFYSPLSGKVSPGVCSGGPRDGQSCLPTTVLSVGVGSAALQGGIAAANAQQLCGNPDQGGRCIAATKIEVIRGIFGQCLERDSTRILGDDRSANPCLTWNPNPILFGEKDPFHYQPTSGYLPPQNSGQYYCTSPAREPVRFAMEYTDFRRVYRLDDPTSPSVAGQDTPVSMTGHYNLSAPHIIGAVLWKLLLEFRSFFPDPTGLYHAPVYAGKMSRLDYDSWWLTESALYPSSDADGAGTMEWAPYLATNSLVGAQEGDADVAQSALACQTSRGTGDGGPAGDAWAGRLWPTALRLVDAGDGYTETFFRINDKEVATKLGATAPNEYNRYLSEDSVGYLRATPAIGNGKGLLTCGYQAAWADNMPTINYADPVSVTQGEKQFRDEFARNYVSYMTRGNEQVLAAGTPGGERAVKMPCLEIDGAAPGAECYFKYWETGYRATQDKRQFDGIFSAPGSNNVVRSLNDIRREPIIARCESDKPYFAIRSMFQSRTENTGAGGAVEASSVQGPWRFVGFWVTACAGTSNGDQRYIYMDMEVGGTNICRELAEVQSINSRQDAAFTDRIWKQGNFQEQTIGTTYSDAAAPFSSAINTGPAGKQPLFQDGQELTGFSPLNPPTFLRSGVVSYGNSNQSPRDKWAYLTNLFARIYRVYQYHVLPVGRGGTACLSGPFKGKSCSTGDDCSPSGECKPAGEVEHPKVGQCYSSATTAAASVGGGNINLHQVECKVDQDCKAAAFYGGDGSIPLLNDCELAPNWHLASGTLGAADAVYTKQGETASYNQDTAATNRGFLCSVGSATVIVRAGCNIPKVNSTECPTWVTGACIVSTTNPLTLGSAHIKSCLFSHPSDFTSEGLSGAPDVECVTDVDCSFTSSPDAVCKLTTVVSTDPAVPAYNVSWWGRCKGGLKDGATCIQGGARPYANSPYSCVTSYGAVGSTFACDRVDNASFVPVTECAASVGGGVENTNTDPDTDNNICTHSAGYKPRLDLCPNPSDEYCGLIAYDLTNANGSLNPVKFPLPTDVTLGHYTPTFLGFSSVGGSFSYVTYYTPRPPRVAAPDTRNCAVPGQCPISRLDAISLDGLADGSVMGGGGEHKSNLRFYAWAAHEQMPLRQVTVDWGDNKTQVIDDTRLKNRKPFCGVQKECKLVAGLTCQIDSDCPPGAGTCVSVGTCEKTPQKMCNTNDDCTVSGVKDTCNIRTMFGNSTDACQQDYFDFAHVYTCGAIEAVSLPTCTKPLVGGAPVNYNQCYYGPSDSALMSGSTFATPGIEFSTRPSCSVVADCATAYQTALGVAMPASITGVSCGPGTGALVSTRCSRDPSRVCTPGAPFTSPEGCAAGDTCIDSLAPPSGCFDATSNSCRFTPRVMIQDNWGWCSGECRGTTVAGNLEDVGGVKVKHPFGGCYTGNVFNGTLEERVRFNTKSTESTWGSGTPASLYVTGDQRDKYGECSSDASGGSVRPWIVYPGSLQLRRSDEIAR